MGSSRFQAHQRNYTIRSYEVDAGGRLSIPSIFNLLQEAANGHALELDVSVSQLLAENTTWVLSRILLKMVHYPVWRDTIQVYTWPSGIRGAFAYRDFDIRNAHDASLGFARSAWIVIDAGTRRPVRPTVFADRLQAAEGDPVMAHILNKLPQPTGDYTEKRFNARYGDLDINQHVNNVSYVEWLLESIPGYGRKIYDLAALEINFLGEAFQGDRALARCLPSHQNAKVYSHAIIRESDQHELIRARTEWK